jgi:3-oxoadipate enol-lactonase
MKNLLQTAPVAPNKTGFLNVEAGSRRIYWEYFGEGNKEVVVMLNGVAMLTRSWYRNIINLQPEYDILLYDYFGQGQSSQEDEPYYIHKFAEYLIGIMDELGIERIHPVGVSYGGFIAAELGRLFQERLYTLTLSGILLTRETLFQLYQELSLMFYRAPEPAFEIYTHYMYEKIFGEKFATTIYGEAMENTRQKFYSRYLKPSVGEETSNGYDRRYCLIRLTEAQNPFFETIDRDSQAYRNVWVPTLILTGEQDRAIPPWQQRKMLDILPNSRQIMIPECGHLTYQERDDFFWPTVKQFFRTKSLNFEPAH